MRSFQAALLGLLALLVLGCTAATVWPPDSTFDSTRAGRLPPLFAAAETSGGGTPATWKVVREDGGHILRVHTFNSGRTFNLCIVEGGIVGDAQVSVRLRADSGEEDQGGGVLWGAQDADNYYVTRWNPLERNVRIYKVEDGQRHQLQSADTELDPAAWHELRAVRGGTIMTVFLDGEQVLQIDDDTFGAGEVGLWTKADASVSFDGFEVR